MLDSHAQSLEECFRCSKLQGPQTLPPLPPPSGRLRRIPPQTLAAATQAAAPQAVVAASSGGGGGAPFVERRWGGEGFRGGASWEVMTHRLRTPGGTAAWPGPDALRQ
jgi:hypothetical protein